MKIYNGLLIKLIDLATNDLDEQFEYVCDLFEYLEKNKDDYIEIAVHKK